MKETDRPATSHQRQRRKRRSGCRDAVRGGSCATGPRRTRRLDQQKATTIRPCNHCRSGDRGFSLIEMVVVLALLGILLSTVGLPLRAWFDGMRVRSALNRVTAEIYRARSVAVRDGSGADLSILADAAGCIDGLFIVPHSDSSSARHVGLDTGGPCLRHSGGASLVFNSRGMLRPPTRSFHAVHGSNVDSVLVSIAGRVRRSYRTRGGGKICRFRQNLPS